MLTALQQLLACRRQRENRAATALGQARAHLERMQAAAAAAGARLAAHHQERRAHQDRLYRRSRRSRLSRQAIDSLNITLDLMAEETAALDQRVRQARAVVETAEAAVAETAAMYQKTRRASDRLGALVDDVAGRQRRQAALEEEMAVEDDLGDRAVAAALGGGS